MKKSCVKLVPKVLSEEQKQKQKKNGSKFQEILDCVRENKEFLYNFINGNEVWVFQYDSEMKRQSSKGHTHTEVPTSVKSFYVKTMLISFGSSLMA